MVVPSPLPDAAPRWPVIIPTKGRAGRLSDAVLSLNPILVVEAEDHEVYARHYYESRFVILPESGRGIAYARNQILAAARRFRWIWFWMLDDDLYDFQDREQDPPTLVKAGAALRQAETEVEEEQGVAMVGLPVVWNKRHEDEGEFRRVRWNTAMYCCVGLYLPAFLGLEYRYPPREDTDMALQVLARGWRTCSVDYLTYQMPMCGTNVGGLAAFYAADRTGSKANVEMAALWPGVFLSSGTYQSHRVRWDVFRRPATPGVAVQVLDPGVARVARGVGQSGGSVLGGPRRPRARAISSGG